MGDWMKRNLEEIKEHMRIIKIDAAPAGQNEYGEEIVRTQAYRLADDSKSMKNLNENFDVEYVIEQMQSGVFGLDRFKGLVDYIFGFEKQQLVRPENVERFDHLK